MDNCLSTWCLVVWPALFPFIFVGGVCLVGWLVWWLCDVFASYFEVRRDRINMQLCDEFNDRFRFYVLSGRGRDEIGGVVEDWLARHKKLIK